MIDLMMALALATAPQPVDRVRNAAPPCPTPPLMLAAYTDKVGYHRLGDLPDANLEVAVNRRQGGCPVPLIVRYQVSR